MAFPNLSFLQWKRRLFFMSRVYELVDTTALFIASPGQIKGLNWMTWKDYRCCFIKLINSLNLYYQSWGYWEFFTIFRLCMDTGRVLELNMQLFVLIEESGGQQPDFPGVKTQTWKQIDKKRVSHVASLDEHTAVKNSGIKLILLLITY